MWKPNAINHPQDHHLIGGIETIPSHRRFMAARAARRTNWDSTSCQPWTKKPKQLYNCGGTTFQYHTVEEILHQLLGR